MQGCTKKHCQPLENGCEYQSMKDHTQCFYWRPHIETAHIINDTEGYLLHFDVDDEWFSIIDEDGDELPGISFNFRDLDSLIKGLEWLKLATRTPPVIPAKAADYLR